MLFINKSGTTNIILTLTELTTLTGASIYYLFNFISDDTQSSMFFTASDISSNTSRYNEFQIIETGSTYVNLTAGTINLPTQGFYHYKVYQMSNPSNLSLSGVTGGPIEYGKVFLSGSNQSQITNEYTGATSLYIYNN